MSSPIGDGNKKTDDKKVIELEEKEKMLNIENRAHDKISEADRAPPSESDENEGSKIKTDFKEGREVKPKKIPIGGIQMPGFFMRSKSKEKCKDSDSEHQGEIEDTELLEQPGKDKVDDSLMNQPRVKLPNPFRKSKALDEDVERSTELKEKKKLVDKICLPFVSVFPKKRKDGEHNLEGQTAGLASMETLDSDKNVNKNDDSKVEEKVQLETVSCQQRCHTYRIAIGALFIFTCVIVILITFICIGEKKMLSFTNSEGTRVEAITSCGKVEGLRDDGAVTFRGIPYARSPIGDLRFREAQPLNDISYCWNGTFQAHNNTDVCLQTYSNGTVAGVEDCLTLDVVTPYVRYDLPLPVIVMIGAENFMGGSPGKMRPSARYARARDVVFVRPNFRLGVLGFLAVEELSRSRYPKISGNYALSDIIVALEWVQLNIQHFGGDPKSVTLFGHQAGATLVMVMATLPEAKNLFARAWATSGSAILPSKSLKETEEENRSFLSHVQCKDATCLREYDAVTLIKSVEDTWMKPNPDLPSKSENPWNRHEWLTVDGEILKRSPSDVWSSPEGLPVKLIIGTTAHAASTQKLLDKYTEWTEELVTSHIRHSILGEKRIVDDALEMYNRSYKGLTAMISDIRVVCPLLYVSKEAHNVSFYIVTQTRGEQDLADVDSDIDAILGRYEPKTPEQRRYISAIQQLFYYFIWNDKLQQANDSMNRMVIVGQDALPSANYSHCDFWLKYNMTQFGHVN